jgi:predicted XRE-type DNA-binding protein
MKKSPTPQQLKDMDKFAKAELYSSVLPPGAPLADKFKHDLCEQIVRYKQKKGLKQKDLGDLLGVHEARISEIVHYKIDKFTADKLMQFLEILNPRAHVKVSGL